MLTHFNINESLDQNYSLAVDLLDTDIKKFESGDLIELVLTCGDRKKTFQKAQGNFKILAFLLIVKQTLEANPQMSGNALHNAAMQYYGNDWEKLLTEHYEGAKWHDSVEFFDGLRGNMTQIRIT